jgi:hypothetical protein
MGDRLIFQSTVFRIQKVEYTAHACLVTDVEDAKEVMAHISLGYYSAHCAPYALRLVDETGEITETYEDLGEFYAGNTLMAVIRSFESLYKSVDASVLVMITRKVSGCFVPDMIQNMKYNAIRTCAVKALTKLNKKMFQTKKVKDRAHHREPESPIAVAVFSENVVTEKKERRNPLPTPSINFDPDSFGIPPIQQKSKADRGNYRPGHFRDSGK